MEKSKIIEEAVKRMRMLKLWDMPEDSIIRRFSETGEPFKSIPAPSGRVGRLYSLTEAEIKMVQDFEQKNGCLVYHLIRNEVSVHPSGVNVLYSFLYVSDRKEEWERDRKDLEDAESRVLYPDAYVYSVGDVPEDADDLLCGYGANMKIGIISGGGGLCRVS